MSVSQEVKLLVTRSNSSNQTAEIGQETQVQLTILYRKKQRWVASKPQGNTLLIRDKTILYEEKSFPVEICNLISPGSSKRCILSILLQTKVSLHNMNQVLAPICSKVHELAKASLDGREKKIEICVVIDTVAVWQFTEEQLRNLVLRHSAETARRRGFGTKPARLAAIEALEVENFQCQGDSIDKGCVVCLEEFEAGVEIKRMPCSHVFHGDCLDQWLKQSNFCPLCRFKLPEVAN